MTYTAVPLDTVLHLMDPIIKDVVKIWVDMGSGDAIRGIMEKKCDELKLHDKVKGLGILDNTGALMAMGWVERNTERYGNMILHALKAEFKPILASELVRSGLMDNAFFELIQYHADPADYSKVFVTEGLFVNKRQRMALFEADYLPKELNLDGLHISPYTLEAQELTCDISQRAHVFSEDYKGYKDLEELPLRKELELRVFDGLYGPVIKEASFLLHHHGVIVACCLVVEIACWGYDKIPWIFDISVGPENHGKGYGRALFQTVVQKLFELEYPLVGLAVTQSNTAAVGLYNSLGFQSVEPFEEFFLNKEKNG